MTHKMGIRNKFKLIVENVKKMDDVGDLGVQGVIIWSYRTSMMVQTELSWLSSVKNVFNMVMELLVI